MLFSCVLFVSLTLLVFCVLFIGFFVACWLFYPLFFCLAVLCTRCQTLTILILNMRSQWAMPHNLLIVWLPWKSGLMLSLVCSKLLWTGIQVVPTCFIVNPTLKQPVSRFCYLLLLVFYMLDVVSLGCSLVFSHLWPEYIERSGSFALPFATVFDVIWVEQNSWLVLANSSPWFY